MSRASFFTFFFHLPKIISTHVFVQVSVTMEWFTTAQMPHKGQRWHNDPHTYPTSCPCPSWTRVHGGWGLQSFWDTVWSFSFMTGSACRLCISSYLWDYTVQLGWKKPLPLVSAKDEVAFALKNKEITFWMI